MAFLCGFKLFFCQFVSLAALAPTMAPACLRNTVCEHNNYYIILGDIPCIVLPCSMTVFRVGGCTPLRGRSIGSSAKGRPSAGGRGLAAQNAG